MEQEYLGLKEELVIDEQESGFSLKKLFSLSFFHWNILGVIIAIFIASSVFWASRSTVFSIPRETAKARKQFFQALGRYEKNALYWDAKLKAWLLTCKELINENKYEELVQQTGLLSDEVFIAFLLKELHLGPSFFERCVVFTKENAATPTFILSKYESRAWPLKLVVTCELELKFKDKKIYIEFSRLRRGEQELSPSLVWSYFGPELELFKQFTFITLPQGDSLLHND